MSEQLVTCLIAVAANLAGMLVIYSVMAHAIVRLAWNGRGIFGVLILIVVTQLFWIAPALLIVAPRSNPDNPASYALWFGNWIVSAFSVVLLCRTAQSIPVTLHDSARLDALGAFGTWRHAAFPFLSRDLTLIAIFTVMATLLPFCAFVTLPEAGNTIVIYERFLSPQGRLGMMAAVSIIGVLPLLAIFFLTKRRP